MATYFLNCSKDIVNYNLCLENHKAGFTYPGYKTGDLIYLIVKKSDGLWYCGAKGNLGEPTKQKPWPDSERFKSAFDISWIKCIEFSITEGLRKIYSNFGLVIRGKTNIEEFENKWEDFQNFMDTNFIPASIEKNIDIKKAKGMNDSFMQYLVDNNLIYEDRIVKRFICALAAKPFVILTGNSGTGKTKLALEFARWIGSEKNYKVVPVGADWTDNRSVLGFFNPLIKKYNSTVILDLIIEADGNKNKEPFLPYS